MARIFYIGFGDLMNSLKTTLNSNSAFEFTEILQLGSDVHTKSLLNCDAFLIGPYTIDPLRQVQRAAQEDNLISIVVLAFSEQYHKVKQHIQFSYNTSKHVTYVLYDFKKDLTPVLANAVLRTGQRKSFSKIGSQQTYPLATGRDITFHNLGLFLENAPIGAILFDGDRNVITANYRAKKMFGQRFSLSGKLTWNDLFPGEVLFPEIDMKVAENQEPIHEIIKVNNQFLDINISKMVLEKSMPHYLLLLNDVTEKINFENQLKSKIEELEFLNQELDEFVNVVSHDFKTPLTSISLLAEMALKETSPEKQLGFIKQIRQSSKKLRESLKGLTVLVDTKKERSEKIELVDLTVQLELVINEYRELLMKIGGEVKVDFTNALTIAYYTAHIDSFLSNLITNAIKYRKLDQPLIIEISSKREKDFTIITIKDNGIGIDLTKNMNKLFKPFKRLTEQGTGSGLGLSIIKRMIEKDHGYLEVFSTPGVGTEFKAYLKDQV